MTRSLYILLAVTAVGGPAGAADDLLTVAAAGHRQTVESIRTLQAKWKARNVHEGRTSHVVNAYQQDGDKKWSRMTSEGGIVSNEPHLGIRSTKESVARGSRITAVDAIRVDGRPPQNHARITNDSNLLSLEIHDFVWVAAGARMTDFPERWLKDVMSGYPGWSWTAEWAVLGGVRTIHATGRTHGEAGKESVSEVWLDPAAGYWPRKRIAYGAASSTTRDDPAIRYETTRFHPSYKKTGISFLAEVAIHYGGLRRMESYITIENIRINDPIPDSQFDLAIPAGYWVVDQVTGKHYTSGPGGKPATPPRPIFAALAPVSTLPPPEDSGWPLSAYLLVGGGVVGCLAGGRLVTVRRAARRAHA